MKLKGINPLEQHAEKLVLGVFALFALGVFVWQLGLFGEGNLVKVGTRSVPPEKTVEVLRDKALEKRAGLERTTKDDSIPDPASLPRVSAKFEDGLTGAVLPVGRLASMGTPDVVPMTGGAVSSGGPAIAGARYALPAIPAASRAAAAVVEGTLDPAFVSGAGPELARLLPAAQPFDKRAVSVQATVDSAAIRAALAGESAAAAAIPGGWWQGVAEILDVELVRQELKPDGSWSDEVVVGAPPAREAAAFRAKLHAPTLDAAGRRELLQREAALRSEIRRPPYYDMISGAFWRPPAAPGETGGADPNRRLIELKKQALLAKRAEIARVKKQLEAPSPSERPAQPGGKPRTRRDDDGGRSTHLAGSAAIASSAPSAPAHAGGAGAGLGASSGSLLAGGGGGGGSRSRGGGGPTQKKSEEQIRREAEAERKKNLETRLKALMADEQKLITELKGLGFDPEKVEEAEAAPPPFAEKPLAVTDQTAGAITVWSHDLTVEPGRTYRYQVRYWLGNPFFGNADRLAADQHGLAAAPALRSPAADWSDPITIDPDRMFFVTSAAAGNQGVLGSEASATVEVFRFFYGYWRRGSESLNLGDPVAVTLEWPELVTFGLSKEGETPGSGSAATAFTTETIPASERMIALPYYLLDVAGDAQAGRAFFGRVEDGGVMVRQPADERTSAVLARVSVSAAAGEKAKVRNPGAASPSAKPGAANPAGESPLGPGELPVREN